MRSDIGVSQTEVGMASPEIGDKFLITAVGRLAGQTIMNTFWYRLTNVGAFSNLLLLYDAINARWAAAGGMQEALLNAYPENLVYLDTWVQRVAPIRIMKNVYPVIEGGNQVAATTANIQASIEKRGELAIKQAIGANRIPISADAVNAVDGLIPAGALKTALGGLAEEIKVEITGVEMGTANLRPIIYQPLNNPGFLNYEIVRTTVMETVRVIRRRTVGLGI